MSLFLCLHEMNGWIQLHRQILEWEWYSDGPTKGLFVHCLLKANWKPCAWKGVSLNRGDFFTSVKSLESDLGLSRQQVRSAINRLKSTSEITTRSTSKGMVITVCNFDSYNSEESDEQPAVQPAIQPSTNHQPTSDQPASNHSLIREEGNKDKKEQTKTRFQKPQMEELTAHFETKGFGKTMAENFTNFYESNGWKVGRNPMKSWKAAASQWASKNFDNLPKINGSETQPAFTDDKF
jgi:hypothetical protein